MLNVRAAVLSALMVCGAASTAIAGPMYRAIVLEKEPQTYDIGAFDMNSKGEVVGYSTQWGAERRPVIWGVDGKIKQIWDEQGLAKIISDDGRVYGHLGSYNGEQAVEFGRDGSASSLESSEGLPYQSVIAQYADKGLIVRNVDWTYDVVFHDGSSMRLDQWYHWGTSQSVNSSGSFLTYYGCSVLLFSVDKRTDELLSNDNCSDVSYGPTAISDDGRFALLNRTEYDRESYRMSEYDSLWVMADGEWTERKFQNRDQPTGRAYWQDLNSQYIVGNLVSEQGWLSNPEAKIWDIDTLDEYILNDITINIEGYRIQNALSINDNGLILAIGWDCSISGWDCEGGAFGGHGLVYMVLHPMSVNAPSSMAMIISGVFLWVVGRRRPLAGCVH